MTKSEWCKFLYESGIFQTGDFTLKSGKKSPYFLNFGAACSGATLARMGEAFAQAMVDFDIVPDLLFGPAYKGLPLAVATVSALYRLTGQDVPYCSFRKEAKQHGEAGRVLGKAPWPGARILLIDDVLTTSDTKLEALEEIGSLSGVLVGVDRQEVTPEGKLYSQAFTEKTGVKVYALATREDLLRG